MPFRARALSLSGEREQQKRGKVQKEVVSVGVRV